MRAKGGHNMNIPRNRPNPRNALFVVNGRLKKGSRSICLRVVRKRRHFLGPSANRTSCSLDGCSWNSNVSPISPQWHTFSSSVYTSILWFQLVTRQYVQYSVYQVRCTGTTTFYDSQPSRISISGRKINSTCEMARLRSPLHLRSALKMIVFSCETERDGPFFVYLLHAEEVVARRLCFCTSAAPLAMTERLMIRRLPFRQDRARISTESTTTPTETRRRGRTRPDKSRP